MASHFLSKRVLIFFTLICMCVLVIALFHVHWASFGQFEFSRHRPIQSTLHSQSLFSKRILQFTGNFNGFGNFNSGSSSNLDSSADSVYTGPYTSSQNQSSAPTLQGNDDVYTGPYSSSLSQDSGSGGFGNNDVYTGPYTSSQNQSSGAGGFGNDDVFGTSLTSNSAPMNNFGGSNSGFGSGSQQSFSSNSPSTDFGGGFNQNQGAFSSNQGNTREHFGYQLPNPKLICSFTKQGNSK